MKYVTFQSGLGHISILFPNDWMHRNIAKGLDEDVFLPVGMDDFIPMDAGFVEHRDDGFRVYDKSSSLAISSHQDSNQFLNDAFLKKEIGFIKFAGPRSVILLAKEIIQKILDNEKLKDVQAMLGFVVQKESGTDGYAQIDVQIKHNKQNWSFEQWDVRVIKEMIGHTGAVNTFEDKSWDLYKYDQQLQFLRIAGD